MKTKQNDLHRKLIAAPHHYALLGVRVASPPEDIRAAHRTLAALLHPDRFPNDPGAHELMARVNVAYTCLSDPAAAARYVAELRAAPGARRCGACEGAGHTVRQKGYRTQLVFRCLDCGGAGVLATTRKGAPA